MDAFLFLSIVIITLESSKKIENYFNIYLILYLLIEALDLKIVKGFSNKKGIRSFLYPYESLNICTRGFFSSEV
jgi:hypothetical protein